MGPNFKGGKRKMRIADLMSQNAEMQRGNEGIN